MIRHDMDDISDEVFDDIVERVDKVFGNIPTAPKKNKVYKPKIFFIFI